MRWVIIIISIQLQALGGTDTGLIPRTQYTKTPAIEVEMSIYHYTKLGKYSIEPNSLPALDAIFRAAPKHFMFAIAALRRKVQSNTVLCCHQIRVF